MSASRPVFKVKGIDPVTKREIALAVLIVLAFLVGSHVDVIYQEGNPLVSFRALLKTHLPGSTFVQFSESPEKYMAYQDTTGTVGAWHEPELNPYFAFMGGEGLDLSRCMGMRSQQPWCRDAAVVSAGR